MRFLLALRDPTENANLMRIEIFPPESRHKARLLGRWSTTKVLTRDAEMKLTERSALIAVTIIAHRDLSIIDNSLCPWSG